MQNNYTNNSIKWYINQQKQSSNTISKYNTTMYTEQNTKQQIKQNVRQTSKFKHKQAPNALIYTLSKREQL